MTVRHSYLKTLGQITPCNRAAMRRHASRSIAPYFVGKREPRFMGWPTISVGRNSIVKRVGHQIMHRFNKTASASIAVVVPRTLELLNLHEETVWHSPNGPNIRVRGASPASRLIGAKFAGAWRRPSTNWQF